MSQIICDAVRKMASNRIPVSDFISPTYDLSEPQELQNLLVIFSTPRSGSTFLCELIHLNSLCLPHEYFQPRWYMPILARRWGSVRGDKIDFSEYAKSLQRYRTSDSGWLGINVHGSQIRYFDATLPHIPVDQPHFIHLRRRSRLDQAVSLFIARQTGQWSSEFKALREAHYAFEGIEECLAEISKEDFMIESYLRANHFSYTDMFYEDLVADTEKQLRRVPGMEPCRQLREMGDLKKQAGAPNRKFADRFAQEWLANNNMKM